MDIELVICRQFSIVELPSLSHIHIHTHIPYNCAQYIRKAFPIYTNTLMVLLNFLKIRLN